MRCSPLRSRICICIINQSVDWSMDSLSTAMFDATCCEWVGKLLERISFVVRFRRSWDSAGVTMQSYDLNCRDELWKWTLTEWISLHKWDIHSAVSCCHNELSQSTNVNCQNIREPNVKLVFCMEKIDIQSSNSIVSVYFVVVMYTKRTSQIADF